MSLIDDLFTEIIAYILNGKVVTSSTAKHQNIIKQHTDKLADHGDIGFPISTKAWLGVSGADPIDFHMEKIIDDERFVQFGRELIAASNRWLFPVQDVKFTPFRCMLFLNREKCFSAVLKTVLYDNPLYGQWHRSSDNSVIVYNVQLLVHSNDNSLTEHRCTLVKRVLVNLLIASGFQIVNDENGNKVDAKESIKIVVTHARSDVQKRIDRDREIAEEQHQQQLYLQNNVDGRKIICGVVRNGSGLSANDYIHRRSMDMEKMAESKYGSEKENVILYDYNKLGAGVVAFDLLKTKHTNVIEVEKLLTQSCTAKGAAFILYNVARVQSILGTFDGQVSCGYYDKLPDFDQIDFALLKEEEEWQMLYVYIIGFPSVLERCILNTDNGQIALHLLCTFLSSFTALFSVYYHRVKILTDNLPQLAATRNARIYLLKAIRVIFLKSLSILEIEPLDQM